MSRKAQVGKNPLGDSMLDIALTVFPDLTKASKEKFLKQMIRIYLKSEGEKPERITELIKGMLFKKVLH